MNKAELVNLINGLVVEAVRHGSDSGGSYDSNEKRLYEKLYSIKTFFELNEYEVIKIDDDYGQRPAIVLKELI